MNGKIRRGETLKNQIRIICGNRDTEKLIHTFLEEKPINYEECRTGHSVCLLYDQTPENEYISGLFAD